MPVPLARNSSDRTSVLPGAGSRRLPRGYVFFKYVTTDIATVRSFRPRPLPGSLHLVVCHLWYKSTFCSLSS